MDDCPASDHTGMAVMPQIGSIVIADARKAGYLPAKIFLRNLESLYPVAGGGSRECLGLLAR